MSMVSLMLLLLVVMVYLQGEDVTVNAKVIKDVKNILKEPIEYLEVRGEVYMTNEAFDKVNEIQEIKGKKLFANPRNCAAGTLKTA